MTRTDERERLVDRGPLHHSIETGLSISTICLPLIKHRMETVASFDEKTSLSSIVDEIDVRAKLIGGVAITEAMARAFDWLGAEFRPGIR